MTEPIRCVVDGSVAIKLFIEQEGSAQNVLWQYGRRANYPRVSPPRSLC